VMCAWCALGRERARFGLAGQQHTRMVCQAASVRAHSRQLQHTSCAHGQTHCDSTAMLQEEARPRACCSARLLPMLNSHILRHHSWLQA
jgi:hypothetical protein